MASIDPRPGQMKAALASVPSGVPIIMLNLLRFRDKALYADGASELTGRQAYEIYLNNAGKHVEACGGSVLLRANAYAGIIAPEDEQWDEVLLVRYPSIEKFVAMVMNPDYQAFTPHRTAALADARLIATVEATA